MKIEMNDGNWKKFSKEVAANAEKRVNEVLGKTDRSKPITAQISYVQRELKKSGLEVDKREIKRWLT